MDVDQENELAEMLHMTGLARMLESEDMEYVVNPTDGGSSAEVVVTYMEMLDCEEVEELGCSSFVNCGDCVSHPGCVYCRDPEFLLQERFQIH